MHHPAYCRLQLARPMLVYFSSLSSHWDIFHTPLFLMRRPTLHLRSLAVCRMEIHVEPEFLLVCTRWLLQIADSAA